VRLLPLASRRAIAKQIESSPEIDAVVLTEGSAVVIQVKSVRLELDFQPGVHPPRFRFKVRIIGTPPEPRADCLFCGFFENSTVPLDLNAPRIVSLIISLVVPEIIVTI
jgi:hypothetical protein